LSVLDGDRLVLRVGAHPQLSDPLSYLRIESIRDKVKCGTYMDWRLHKLPFHKFGTFVSYNEVYRPTEDD
jgi:putative transposase